MTQVIRWKECVIQGVTPDVLRGPAWHAMSHGLHQPADAPRDLVDRCWATKPALPPGAPFSHWTAAQLLGLWVPRPPSWLPLMATLPPSVDRPERQGLYVARARAGYVPSTVHPPGIAVVTPEVCVAQLAEDLRLVDLVVAIDSAMQLYATNAESILSNVRRRQRGLPMLRKALALADGRSESAWETVLRLIHVTSGFEVEPQHKVRDRRA